MDIRARLLIAFLPLLLVVAFLAVTFALFTRTGAEVIAAQRERTDDLIETQEIVLAIFLEHDITSHIATGEEPANSPRYAETRARVEEMVAAEVSEPTTALDDDAAIREEYAALALLHDAVVAAALAGDIGRASELFERPEVDATLERIIATGEANTEATRAAIALTDAETEASAARIGPLITLGLALSGLIAFVFAWLLLQQIVGPLNRLAADAEQFAAGDLAGDLSPVGNISQLQRLRSSFQKLIDANRSRQASLKASLDEIQQRVSREEHLRETVAALSVPVVPLAEDTLLLPLVGYLDQRRAADLTRGLLEAVRQRRARSVVIDITGLADLDAATAERLRRTGEAARLLGCGVTLVGVRAEQALTLSELGLQASGIKIERDIPSVLRKSNGA